MLFFSISFFTACKDEEVDGIDQVVYALSENGEYYICKGKWHYCANSSIDINSELVIEAYICGKPVREIASSAFYGLGAKKVIVPDTVTKIGDYAFYCSEGLKEVVLSKNLESIGSYAFSRCENLENIILPNSLVSIGDYCFSYDNSLKSLYIPDAVMNIGKAIFVHTNNEKFKVYCECSERLDTWDEKCFYGINENNVMYDYKEKNK